MGDKRSLTVRIEPGKLKLLKLTCIDNDVTVQDAVNDAITDWLKNKTK